MRKGDKYDGSRRRANARSMRNGYIIIGGRDAVYEHRAVMEQVLGRPLRKGEIVHHINHDRTDNRIENLSLTTHRDHAVHHNDAHARAAQSARMKQRWATDEAFANKVRAVLRQNGAKRKQKEETND